MDNIIIGILSFILGAQLQKEGSLDKLRDTISNSDGV